MNYDLFRRYLASCTEEGLVEVTKNPGADEVRLTSDGREAHRRLTGRIHDLLGEGTL